MYAIDLFLLVPCTVIMGNCSRKRQMKGEILEANDYIEQRIVKGVMHKWWRRPRRNVKQVSKSGNSNLFIYSCVTLTFPQRALWSNRKRIRAMFAGDTATQVKDKSLTLKQKIIEWRGDKSWLDLCERNIITFLKNFNQINLIWFYASKFFI